MADVDEYCGEKQRKKTGYRNNCSWVGRYEEGWSIILSKNLEQR